MVIQQVEQQEALIRGGAEQFPAGAVMPDMLQPALRDRHRARGPGEAAQDPFRLARRASAAARSRRSRTCGMAVSSNPSTGSSQVASPATSMMSRPYITSAARPSPLWRKRS